MEAKCSFCELFDKKPHCHNCKVFNKTRTHVPKEIDCSLEELVEYINTHGNDDITERFEIGDYKIIELYTGEKVKIILLDTDKDQLADDEGNAKTTFGILSCDSSFRMNESDDNRTSWKDCKMRTVYIDRMFRLLPEAIRNNIKPVIKYTSAGGGSSDIITTTDKCFLFSEVEICGTTTFSKQGEGKQYEYFMLGEETRMFDGHKHLRSPYFNRYFCFISRDGGINYQYANNFSGVAFGFCI